MMEQTMKKLSDRESKEMLRNFLYVSIISADNDELPEDTKQEIITRYGEHKDNKNWNYILQPMLKAGIPEEKVDRYIKLFEE